MIKDVLFQSENYCQISWQEVFNMSSVAVVDNNSFFGLGNSKGLIMHSENINFENDIVLLTKSSVTAISVKCLKPMPLSFLNEAGMFLSQLTVDVTNKNKSNLYEVFINKIVANIFIACKKIAVYTHEHLSNRYYENKRIVNLDVVQSHFSDCMIILSRVEQLIKLSIKTDQISFLLKQLMNLLVILSRLAGARAVLKNNAIEFLFFIRLFEKFIEV